MKADKPMAVFRLTVLSEDGKGHGYLPVYIWRRVGSMRRHLKDLVKDAAPAPNKAYGAYLQMRTGNGEIHVWVRAICPFTMTHEIEHFIQHWMEKHETLPLSRDARERLAWLTGSLNQRFAERFTEWADRQLRDT